MPSPRRQHGLPGPGSSGGGALSSTESPGGGGGALSSAGGDAGGTPPGLAIAGVEAPPSAVGVDPSSSLREPASRPSSVGGSGWRHIAPSPVLSPEPASGGSPRLESQDLERALSVSWASRLGCVEDLSLPRVARFLTGRHVACCLSGANRKEGV